MGWRRFFPRAWWDDERARELESHVQIETDEYIARGVSPDRARAATLAAAARPCRPTNTTTYSSSSATIVPPISW
jgi:hypothetical protein